MMVRVNPPAPAVTLSGVAAVIEGVPNAVIRKSTGDDVPVEQPGVADGLTTRTAAIPSVAIRLAATVAVIALALLNVVGRAVPFHSTVDREQKFAPVTERVNAPPPAPTVD